MVLFHFQLHIDWVSLYSIDIKRADLHDELSLLDITIFQRLEDIF